MAGDWYIEAFRADYLDLYAHRDAEDAARAVWFIRDIIPVEILSPGAPMLDCACGAGRHLLPLRLEGMAAVGIDLSLDLLRHSLDKAGATGAGGGGHPAEACVAATNERRAALPVACADMRVLPFGDGAFAVVLSLFTSFGYFEGDEENLRVMREFARVLRPGGRLILDFLNAPRVRGRLVARSERALADGGRLIEERSIAGGRGLSGGDRVIKRAQRVWADGRVREWIESVRLYEVDELETMLSGCGLTVLSRHGDFDGSPYAPVSPRCLLVARR